MTNNDSVQSDWYAGMKLDALSAWHSARFIDDALAY
jgi:hypothetical protein